MKVDTSCGDGVAAGEELTINYSPGHSGQDPRSQHPPFYFGIFYGEHVPMQSILVRESVAKQELH